MLLKREARLDVKDTEKQGILHVAAALSDFQTLTILKRYEALIRDSCGIEDKDIRGHTPLEVFDTLRGSYVTEDEETRLKTRAAFLSLLGFESQQPTDTSENLVQGTHDLDSEAEISEEPRETFGETSA